MDDDFQDTEEYVEESLSLDEAERNDFAKDPMMDTMTKCFIEAMKEEI